LYQFKGLANKSKFKENQRALQEISRQLRESTKSLCHNLKENPNFTGNLMKIQQERDQLIELLYTSYNEISKFGTFQNLLHFIDKIKQKNEKSFEILKKEKEAIEEVKKLNLELQKEKNEHQKEIENYKITLNALKENVVFLKKKNQMDLKFAKQEAKAKRSSTARMYRQLIEEQEEKNVFLEKNVFQEKQVHEETCIFLKKHQLFLQKENEKWNLQLQQDIQKKQFQLQEIKQKKQNQQQKLDFFQKKWQKEMEILHKKKEEKQKIIELENFKKQQANKMQISAKKIQICYQKYHNNNKKKEQEQLLLQQQQQQQKQQKKKKTTKNKK
jgi:hypothetical protein